MLKLENVSFSANENGKKSIIKNINYTFLDNKNYCITGANGCGKSTLAKIIMGVFPITSGKIVFNNVDITNLSITERANLGIGFAFQNPVKFKGLTARDLLDIASGTPLNTTEACDKLASVGLCAREYLDRELDSTLSGGELKRIEIGSVLARKCSLNIFDEPEAGIDIWSFNKLVNIFNKTRSQKCTNIIISHQEKLLASADEIILISDGTICDSGTPQVLMPKLTNMGTCTKLREAL